jgi:hypothetical protein
MIGRTMLAILDNNENVGREQAMTKSGEPAWYRVFPRGLPFCRRWKIRPIKVAKTFEFRREIGASVLRKLYDGVYTQNVLAEETDEDPLSVLNRPTIPLAATEKPSREELLAKRMRRSQNATGDFSHS